MFEYHSEMIQFCLHLQLIQELPAISFHKRDKQKPVICYMCCSVRVYYLSLQNKKVSASTTQALYWDLSDNILSFGSRIDLTEDLAGINQEGKQQETASLLSNERSQYWKHRIVWKKNSSKQQEIDRGVIFAYTLTQLSQSCTLGKRFDICSSFRYNEIFHSHLPSPSPSPSPSFSLISSCLCSRITSRHGGKVNCPDKSDDAYSPCDQSDSSVRFYPLYSFSSRLQRFPQWLQM